VEDSFAVIRKLMRGDDMHLANGVHTFTLGSRLVQFFFVAWGAKLETYKVQ
jgi:hypothetical protein